MTDAEISEAALSHVKALGLHPKNLNTQANESFVAGVRWAQSQQPPTVESAEVQVLKIKHAMAVSALQEVVRMSRTVRNRETTVEAGYYVARNVLEKM